MKVLYLSYDGMCDALGRSQVIPYLQGLAKKGHRIHIISCEKKENYKKDGTRISRILSDSHIGWTPLKFTTFPPFVTKIYDLLKLRSAAMRHYKKGPFDVVHCRSYVAAFAGMFLQKKKGVRFVFDMRGFWVDERIEGNIWSLKNPLHRLAIWYFRKLETEYFRKADAVVCLTEKGRQIIGDRFGGEVADNTKVIPCCADTAHFSPDRIPPATKEAARLQLGIEPSQLVLSYLGSTGTWYQTKEMLMFFKRMLRFYPDSKFLFITGDQPSIVLDMAQTLKIDPARFAIIQSDREHVPLYLSLSSISIYFIKPVFSKIASSPTKQGETLSMGIPFITNSGVGDIEQIVAEGTAGILVDDLSEEAFDQAVAKIPEMLGKDPQTIRKFAMEKFSLESGVEKYHKIYEGLRK